MKSGKLMALIGASRSGKTQKALQELKRHKLVMIWDVEGQYKATHRATNRRDLWRLVKACAGKRATIAYTGSLSDFSFFCRCAWWWIRANYQAGKPCAVVFEETADVTSPAKAPNDYGVILRRALKYGVDLFAITQRPAESDKTAIGNASIVHVCRMQLPSDRKSVSQMTGIPLKDIEALRADQDQGLFDYITVDTGKGLAQKGRLSFPRNKPVFKSIGEPVPL